MSLYLSAKFTYTIFPWRWQTLKRKSKRIQTDRAPAAIGPYSQGISVGDWVFVSGQLGLIPETSELAGGGFALQGRQALNNLRQILLAEGCDFQDVVSVDVFLTDMNRFLVFNDIYQEFFSHHRPARAVVEVSALPKGADIEIKCIAMKGSG
jgi:2-iminobutanoate/2-iminopropanoate deaminase